MHLSAAHPDELRAGEGYATWVVSFRAGQPVGALRVLSRACRTGPAAG